MEQRFIVLVEFYEYGETPRDAKLRAEQKCKDLNDAFDVEAKITKIWEAPFGKVPKELTPQQEKAIDDMKEKIREQDIRNENLQKEKI